MNPRAAAVDAGLSLDWDTVAKSVECVLLHAAGKRDTLSENGLERSAAKDEPVMRCSGADRDGTAQVQCRVSGTHKHASSLAHSHRFHAFKIKIALVSARMLGLARGITRATTPRQGTPSQPNMRR